MSLRKIHALPRLSTREWNDLMNALEHAIECPIRPTGALTCASFERRLKRWRKLWRTLQDTEIRREAGPRFAQVYETQGVGVERLAAKEWKG